jgi:hypothetical protein
MASINSIELLALLHCELWAVCTFQDSAVHVAVLYDFAVALKHTFGDGYYSQW